MKDFADAEKETKEKEEGIYEDYISYYQVIDNKCK